jgi:hypothetical protein
VLALVLACAWVMSLALLAFTQSNPVTLNREQILHADLIVSARIDDAERGVCMVEQQWGDAGSLDSITVSNLTETQASSGGTYILPLKRGPSGAYEVIAARLPSRPYLVYPATPGVIRQVQELLDDR